MLISIFAYSLMIKCASIASHEYDYATWAISCEKYQADVGRRFNVLRISSACPNAQLPSSSTAHLHTLTKRNWGKIGRLLIVKVVLIISKVAISQFRLKNVPTTHRRVPSKGFNCEIANAWCNFINVSQKTLKTQLWLNVLHFFLDEFRLHL